MINGAIVIGGSFGAPEVLKQILPKLPIGFPLPIIITLHVGDHRNDIFIEHMNSICQLPVIEAECSDSIKKGIIYFAPAKYHLLIEEDFSFSLSLEEKINYSRPSIDVLFETAAWAFKDKLIGLILSGANSDGAMGMKWIHQYGGKTIVQAPEQAIATRMPEAAIQTASPNYILPIEIISEKLIELAYQISAN